jgi:hypothetical protein
MLLVISIFQKIQHKCVIFQILLIYILINNVYYLSTHYSVLPYGDSYWDYNVVRTFLQSNSIYTILEQTGPAAIQTWYSGWPAIHTIAVMLSTTTGITPFQIVLLLPLIMSLGLFLIVYLFLKKISISLNLDKEIVYIGLLIFTLSPDVFFWRTQFVRLSLGMLFVFTLYYLIYKLILQPINQRRTITCLATIIVLSLVITHHFASFIAMSFLLLLFIFQIASKRIEKTKIGSKLFGSTLNIAILSLASIMLISIFIWWESFGTVIWPTVATGVSRFIRVIIGAREAEFYVPQPQYPAQLTATWTLTLLRLRDILMLVPSIFGLLLLWIKKPKTPQKLFIIYSILIFGLIFIINDITFKMEPFRLVTLALPFLALLTAIAYNTIKNKSRHIWHIFLPTIMILLVTSSFLGLWGHSFAPMHLYNPNINPSEIGEHTNPTQLNSFFNEKIPFGNIIRIWSDDVGSLILLIETNQSYKIRRLAPEDVQKIGKLGLELITEFSDLNVYKYYASVYSTIRSPEEAKAFAQTLKQHLISNCSRIYDDGQYRLWENKPGLGI